jgi:superfamily II DNA/RNA helicase
LIRSRNLSQVIVFTNTKIGAGRLARQLEQDGLNASAIHGDKSQQERLQTLEQFKKGELSVLVATDVAARGLDIAELPAVINYDLPYSPEDYVHRIGRTGRAGASGVALSLMTAGPDERLHVEIEKLLKRKLPLETLDLGHRERSEHARHPERDDEADSRQAMSRRNRDSRLGRERDARPATASPRAPLDPFFYQPYEPSDTVATAAATAPTRPAVRGRRTIAVLLGGSPKS